MRCIGGCDAELVDVLARQRGWGALDRDSGLCPPCGERHGFGERKPLRAAPRRFNQAPAAAASTRVGTSRNKSLVLSA